MDRATAQKILSVMLLLPFALTTPLRETLSLEPRGGTKGMWIGLCNSCVPTGAGFPDCEQRHFSFFGDEFAASCQNDYTAPFNDDFCSTFGTVPIPFRDGYWGAGGSCNEQAPPGTAAGIIVPHEEAGSHQECECNCVTADKEEDSQDCGTNGACNVVWRCTCTDGL